MSGGGQADKCVGDYTLGRVIAAGDFGVLYDTKKGREVYTTREKTVEEQWAVDNEISLMSGIPRHANVVTFIHSVPQEKKVYFILENCNIGTLNDYIIKEKPMASFVMGLMLDSARGIFHLHRNMVIHRDVNPENILLASGPKRPICKISNFGLAQYCYKSYDCVPNVLDVSTHTDIKAFLENRCKGKFWPPEIKEPGDTFRFASDVFSLGLVFLAILSPRIVCEPSLTKDMLLPPLMKKGENRHLPLCLCSVPEINEVIHEYVATRQLQQFFEDVLLVPPMKRPHVTDVVTRLEGFVSSDRAIPINMIVALSIAIVLIVIVITWKLTF